VRVSTIHAVKLNGSKWPNLEACRWPAITASIAAPNLRGAGSQAYRKWPLMLLLLAGFGRLLVKGGIQTYR